MTKDAIPINSQPMSSAMFTNAGQLREKGTGLGTYRMSFLRRQSSASAAVSAPPPMGILPAAMPPLPIQGYVSPVRGRPVSQTNQEGIRGRSGSFFQKTMQPFPEWLFRQLGFRQTSLNLIQKVVNREISRNAMRIEEHLGG